MQTLVTILTEQNDDRVVVKSFVKLD